MIAYWNGVTVIESFVVSVYKGLSVVIYSSQLLNFQTLVFRSWNFDTGALLKIYTCIFSYNYL